MTLPTTIATTGVPAGDELALPGCPTSNANATLVGRVESPEAESTDSSTELMLMAVSVLAAFGGIGVATFFFLQRPDAADAMAARFSGIYRLLMGKYYVDEIYDSIIVQPIKRVSTVVLWRVTDAGVIDGTVNGLGLVVRGSSAVWRRLQTGSVRAYAMSFFAGVVVIVGYYLWR